MAAGDKIFAGTYGLITARPLVILRKSTITSVATGGAALTWDTEDIDTDDWHSTSVNTGRITPSRACWIQFTATVHWASNATGRRGAAIRKNGSSIYYGVIQPGSSAGNTSVTVVRTLQANGTSDYFEVLAFQDSGGNLNTADVTNTVFEAVYARD